MDPFLALDLPGRADPARSATAPAGTVLQRYEAAVAGVRSRFAHLAAADIFSPPHGWADAQLARQIALHLAIARLQADQGRLAAELERSRAALNRAIETVEERLGVPEFAAAYRAMGDAAETALSRRIRS